MHGLFVCWNLFCTIVNLRIKCVTETKNVSVSFYKNLKSSFSTWLTRLILRFLHILGCTGLLCAATFSRLGQPNMAQYGHKYAHELSPISIKSIMTPLHSLRRSHIVPTSSNLFTNKEYEFRWWCGNMICNFHWWSSYLQRNLLQYLSLEIYIFPLLEPLNFV